LCGERGGRPVGRLRWISVSIVYFVVVRLDMSGGAILIGEPRPLLCNSGGLTPVFYNKDEVDIATRPSQSFE
jgi:hypothetical protein